MKILLNQTKTIDLINLLKKIINRNLFLLWVQIILINFHKWHKWKINFTKCNILVFDRQGYQKKIFKIKDI